MIDDNSLDEVNEALDLVENAVSHEPIFSKKEELSEFNLIREDLQDLEEEEDTTLEDFVVGVYTALPEDVQDGIREGYQSLVGR